MLHPSVPDRQLVKQVAVFMAAFGRAQQVEARAAGTGLQAPAADVSAGLVSGVTRAYCRRARCDRQAVPRVLRELARLRPEYAGVPACLMSELGSDTVAAWAELAEAAVEAVDMEADPLPVLLEFACLLRLHAPEIGVQEAVDFDPVGTYLHTHPDDGASPRERH
jgi:hypothetical protein